MGAAIVLHAISFVPVTLLGIYFMAREGLTLAGARKMAEENAPKPSQGSDSGMPRQAESASSVNGEVSVLQPPRRQGGGLA